MDQFQGTGTPPGFSVTLDPAAFAKGLLLASAEVKEAQQYGSGTVGNADQKAAPFPETDIRCLYLGQDYRFYARTKIGNGSDPGAVLVAMWQVEEKIFRLVQSDPFKLRSELRSDSGERL